MLKKIADAVIQMSYEIPNEDKILARNIIEDLIKLKTTIEQSSELLNKTQPFEKHQTVSTEALVEKRGVLGRYHKEVKNSFSECKKHAFLIIEKMKNFDTDHNIAELISSLKEGMEDLEKKAEDFLAALDNIRSTTFRENLLDGVKKTKEQCEKVKDLIEERIEDHFQKNFLPNQWSESVSQLVQQTIAPNMPLMKRLFEEREKALQQGSAPQISKRPQSLSPAMTQNVQYATDQRGSANIE